MEWLLFDYIFDVTPVGIMAPVCVLCVYVFIIARLSHANTK